MMALSDETLRGKPHTSSSLPTWHAHTAASSHMTDNPKNFKGPLRPTRRITKVYGRNLLCCEMGESTMVTENGVGLLKECLLVPGLGVNLISVRKACVQAGLNSVLDARAKYLVKGEMIIFTAIHENGIYSFNSISPLDINKIALHSQQLQICLEVNKILKYYINSKLQWSDQLQKALAAEMKNVRTVWTKTEMMHKYRKK